MDITTAGAWTAFTYQSALQSGTQAQALAQAFQAASLAGAQVTQMAGGGSDASLLDLSTQPSTSLATYQVAAQAGTGASSIQAMVAASPNTDLLLAAGLNDGSQAFPVAGLDATASWSGFEYALAVGSGQTGTTYAQQLAASAAALQTAGSLNLLA